MQINGYWLCTTPKVDRRGFYHNFRFIQALLIVVPFEMELMSGRIEVSPCMGKCSLNEDEICLGCFRSLDEKRPHMSIYSHISDKLFEPIPCFDKIQVQTCVAFSE
jgi:hypothetical protein